MSTPTKTKRRTNEELAQRISAYLSKWEADRGGVNKSLDGKAGGLRWYYNAGAHAAGRYVRICYVSYQGSRALTKDEAELYLAALDDGFIGTHYEAFRKLKAANP